jgi:hypothetical protein
MSRPKSWFIPKEVNIAKKQAKERGHNLWQYTLKTKSGNERGYYVGAILPKKLTRAQVEKKI